MPRYRIIIEYDGTPFVGWQIQSAGVSVQSTLVAAIAKLSGETVEVRGAGRTDSGVHALGQVAHFDLTRAYPTDVVREAVNYHARPWPVSIRSCELAAPGFDARFSATKRHYLYRILSRRAPPALDKGRVWWVARGLDATAMAKAAPVLVGRHDFTTFRAAGCQAASPVKTLEVFEVTTAHEEIHIRASARSFMHKQVRSMVGSLKLVGEGRWTAEDLAAALAARDRARCGPVAPACGLYLTRVDYDAPSDGAALPPDDSEE
ncbi:MAG: tRNA pseudouridine(38-40) synthase TruA [Hyphomicrobiales bacterium]|nr:tRNA pseudouridine(38-40) synthase TruA [Hyphomicrobiales bacterium]